MAIFKCKMCGGTLEVNDETIAVCQYCGTKQTFLDSTDLSSNGTTLDEYIKHIKLGKFFLGEKKWHKSKKYFYEALKINSESYEANLGKLFCKLKISSFAQNPKLIDISKLNEYNHTLKVANKEQKEQLEVWLKEKNTHFEKVSISKAKRKKKCVITAFIITFTIIIVCFLYLIIAPKIKYNRAISAMNRKDYVIAYETFEQLGGYKESKRYLSDILIEYRLSIINKSKVNDIVFLDNEEEWLIVERKENKVLLILKNSMTFNAKNIFGGWANSSLRMYLNSEFYETAFSDEIKPLILPTQLINSNDIADITTDRIFILSSKEIKEYMKANNQTYATQLLRDVNDNRYILYNPNGECLEREYINNTTQLSGYEKWKSDTINESIENASFCPAMWIDIGKID